MTPEQLDRKIQTLSQLLDVAETDAALMENEAFQAWLDREFEDAKRRCVMVVENLKSNYEKAMAAGIMRYWRSKKGELSKHASVEYRQRLREKLEELNGRLGNFDGVSTGDENGTGWSPGDLGTF